MTQDQQKLKYILVEKQPRSQQQKAWMNRVEFIQKEFIAFAVVQMRSTLICQQLPGRFSKPVQNTMHYTEHEMKKFGQIHCIIREMLQVQFGMETWNEVLRASGLDEDTYFQVFSMYEDAVTTQLIETVRDVLEVPLNTVLKEFGIYFVMYCLQHGYDSMLLTLGQDMYSFINNLDSLHSMLSLSYRGMLTPSFRCEDDGDGSLTVHYYSSREGLYPMVTGLVEAVAKDLYNQTAKLTLVSQDKVQVDTNKFKIHHLIKVDLQDRSRGSGLVSGKTYSSNKPRNWRQHPTSDQQLSALLPDTPVITMEDQVIAFPYHMLLDNQLYVKQCGQCLRNIVPGPITMETRLSDFAHFSLPIMAPTAHNIRHFINSIFYISVRTGSSKPRFVLKGQFMSLPTCGYLLFMGSPHVLSLSDFQEMHVCMADLPLYDCTRELVLLNQQRLAEIDVAKRLDETTLKFKEMSLALEAEKRKAEEMLHEMMPLKIARQLTMFGYAKAEKYECCTILFCDIVTFTNITAMCEASQVINMLNDLYRRFDIHTDFHGVYKVETIGDAYMAVTGVPEVQEDHAELMADYAMDVLEESGNVLSPATGLPLQIRLGLHTGSVVAGVIGKKKPRFDIYGDTVTTASRMESNGIAGRIHLSERTFERLYPHGYVFKTNGQIEIKGKGKMTTYFLVGTLDRDLQQPDDKFSSLPDVFDPELEADPWRKKIIKRTLPPLPPEAISIVDNQARQNRRRSVTWKSLAEKVRKIHRKVSFHRGPQGVASDGEPWLASSAMRELPTSTAYNRVSTSSALQSSLAESVEENVYPTTSTGATFSFLPNVSEIGKLILPVPSSPQSFSGGSASSSMPTSSQDPRKASALKRVELSPFQKYRKSAAMPEKDQPYTNQQMSILPFGVDSEENELHNLFFRKPLAKNNCTVL